MLVQCVAHKATEAGVDINDIFRLLKEFQLIDHTVSTMYEIYLWTNFIKQ